VPYSADAASAADATCETPCVSDAEPADNVRRELRWASWIVMTVGVVGALAVWWSISERGIGLTSDSVSYWSTAERILADGAFGSPWQQPLTAWPLGYAVLLAVVSAVLGISVLSAGTLIAVSLPPATAWLSWRLLNRVAANPMLVIGGVLAATLAGPVLTHFNKLLTDGFFTVGVLALVLLLCRVVEAEHAGRIAWLAAAITLTSWLCLLRYVGVLLPLIGAAALALTMTRHRFRVAFGFFSASLVVPLAYWIWRSVVTDRAIGSGPQYGVTELPGVVTGWLTLRPALNIPSAVGFTALIALASAVVVMILRFERRAAIASSRERSLTLVAAFWLLNLVGILALRFLVEFYIESRTLLPTLPLAIIVVAGLLDQLDPTSTKRLGIGAFLIWTALAAGAGVDAMIKAHDVGSGFRNRGLEPLYADLVFMEQFLPPECRLVSNDVELLYVAGFVAEQASDARPVGSDGASPPTCLIWVEQPGGTGVEAIPNPWRPDLSRPAILETDRVGIYRLRVRSSEP
jgi:hypothetical protein